MLSCKHIFSIGDFCEVTLDLEILIDPKMGFALFLFLVSLQGLWFIWEVALSSKDFCGLMKKGMSTLSA